MGGLLIGINNVSFSPLSLSPTAWFRSDLGITQSGGKVSQWNDQSGNGYNVSQSNATFQPTYSASGGPNGTPALGWTGATNSILLQNTSFTYAAQSQPTDIFVVATCNVSLPIGNGAYCVDLGSNTDVIFVATGSSTLTAYNGDLLAGASNITQNAAFVAELCNIQTSSSFITINGTSTSTGALGDDNQGSTDLTIGNFGGGSNGWQGTISEVLVFNYELNSTQRAKVLSYVSSRYGITT
jgi:hypothetical protein